MFSVPVISEKTVARLALYRRLLVGLVSQGRRSIYSHEPAGLAKVSAAVVRRDLMAVGYEGSPTRGYAIDDFVQALSHRLDHPATQQGALVGVANLGRALLAYVAGRAS